MRNTRRMLRLVTCVATGAGCTGTITGAGLEGPSGVPGNGAAPALPADPPVTPGGPAPASGARASAPAAAPAGTCAPLRSRLWRLTPVQYVATLKAAVPGVPDAISDDLASVLPARGGVFTNDAKALVLTQPYFDRMYDLATGLAQQAVRDPARVAPCLAEGVNDAGCIRTALASVGAKMFRRPLQDDELSAYLTYFDKARTAGVPVALANVLRLILISPNAVFRTENGTAPATPGRSFELSTYEKASALSYFLTDGPPDARLAQAAADGSLASPGQMDAHARRLLATAETAPGLLKFLNEQLDTDAVKLKTKSSSRFPGVGSSTLADMAGETKAFFQQVLWREDGTLATLLTASYSMLTDRLAKVYGVSGPVPAGAFGKFMLPAGQRAGLLTQGSFLAAQAGEEETDIVLRGKFVRERLLCQELPPPPPTVNAVPPKPDGVRTQRERLAVHAADASCAGCHKLMDPIGLAFESYDAAGRWRTVEANKPVDTRGLLAAVAAGDVPVASGIELGGVLARTPEVSACLVQQMLTYALGDAAAGRDACRVGKLTAGLGTSGGKILDLVAAVAASDAFSLRAN